MKKDVTSLLVTHKLKIAVAAVVVAALLALVFVGKGDKAQAPSGQQGMQQLADAPQQQGQPQEAWLVRCEEPPRENATAKPYCEVFQALVMQETNQRFAEFAIGFPEDMGKDAARGVIVLPLGILLTDGIQMQVDEGQKYKFQVRYCSSNGCFAFVNLNKDLLEALRKGKETKIIAKATTGQDMIIKMTLEGFNSALKKISS